MALPIWVRWRISISRTRCNVKTLCFSTVFGSTKRIAGRPTALADRFGVGGVVLLPLDVGFDIGWRHQPHLVAERKQFPRLMVRGGACLDADHATRQPREERQYPAARQPLTQHDLSPGADGVHLKNRLGDNGDQSS